MNRRTATKLLIGSALAAPMSSVLAWPRSTTEPVWTDALDLGILGRGFDDVETPYDRLPSASKDKVRGAVWNLSLDSAGLHIKFNTTSPEVYVRYRLRRSSLAMPHMAATGVSGVDLYAQDESGQWRWLGCPKPSSQDVQARLTSGLDSRAREFMAYLPLYNGIERLEIGVGERQELSASPALPGKPIVYYGTSITQGACASRPGMAFTSILSRRLSRTVINLGFSGQGRMDDELARQIGRIDSSIVVVDCLPNMGADLVTQKTGPLVKTIRESRPDTPIVLVEDRTLSQYWIQPPERRHHRARRKALRDAYDRLVGQGVENLHYVEGEGLLGEDSDATVDGSHPTDLGMVRYADALEPVLARILGDSAGN